MGGYSPTIVRLCALTVGFWILISGCGSSTTTTSGSGRAPADSALNTRASADHWKVEAEFTPSDHDPFAETSAPAATSWGESRVSPSGDDIAAPPTGDMVSGFRVQVLATGRIDEARAKKGELEVLFPNEWFYLEYDPPTYKIRAGNFVSRVEADRFARGLSEQGYTEAWTVPARIFSNPPKRTPPTESPEPPAPK